MQYSGTLTTIARLSEISWKLARRLDVFRSGSYDAPRPVTWMAVPLYETVRPS